MVRLANEWCTTLQGAQPKLGSKSTALEALRGANLEGKTAVVTGGNSGIGVETIRALATAGADVVLCSRSLAAGEAVAEELRQSGVKVRTICFVHLDLSFVSLPAAARIRGGGAGVLAAALRLAGLVTLPPLPSSALHHLCTSPACRLPGRLQGKIIVRQLDLADFQSIQAFAEGVQKELPDGRLDLLLLNAGVMALPSRQLTKDGFEMQLGTNHIGHQYLTTLLLPQLKKVRGALGSGQKR